MSAQSITPPDWFDRLWAANLDKIPIYLRNEATKKLARGLIATGIESMGEFAKTPEGVRQVVAYARILSALRGVQGAFTRPDPSPEEVVAFVERLVQRVKP